MSNPEGLAIARQLIATEAQQQTGFLDLGMLGLTELPEEIHQLSHLRRLNLGGWYDDEDGRQHYSMNLLDSNDFTDAPLPPLRFPFLESLSIVYTWVSDLSSLSGLTSLRSLDCSEMWVSDLSPLSQLTRLQTRMALSSVLRGIVSAERGCSWFGRCVFGPTR